jgi:tetratricopeptide (TPR) repeat protein
VSTSSLEALRRYGLGVRLLSMGRNNEALPLLRQAVQLDTGFSMAWNQIWVSLYNGGRDLDGQLDALAHAYANRDRLTETQRYATEADYFDWVKRDRSQARRAWESVLAIDSNNNTALTNLGLLTWFEEDYPEAARLAARAIRSDSNQLSPYTNLLDAQVALKQYAAADTTLARWRARFGADAEYRYSVGNMAYVRGDFDTAAAAWRRNLDQREDAAERSRAAVNLSRLAAVRGRLGDGRRFDRLAAETAPDPGDRLRLPLEQASIELSLGVGREDALALAERVGSSAEFTALLAIQRPYDQLAMLYALAGRSDRARAVAAEQSRMLAAAGPAGERFASSLVHQMFADALEGTLLLNEKRFADAEASFTRAHAAFGGVYWLPQIGLALDRAGKSDSALAVYERYLSSTFLYRVRFDAFGMVHVLRRTGEMYEAKGDRVRAIERYERIVSLWREADPVLQPQVTDVKRRLADLTGEPR